MEEDFVVCGARQKEDNLGKDPLQPEGGLVLETLPFQLQKIVRGETERTSNDAKVLDHFPSLPVFTIHLLTYVPQ